MAFYSRTGQLHNYNYRVNQQYNAQCLKAHEKPGEKQKVADKQNTNFLSAQQRPYQ